MSLPVPPGIMPRNPLPRLIRPFATSLTVPSPPTAITIGDSDFSTIFIASFGSVV